MKLIKLWNESFDINDFKKRVNSIDFSKNELDSFLDFIEKNGFNIKQVKKYTLN